MVYVELPEVGTVVKKGETFGVIESVKVCFQLSWVVCVRTTQHHRLQPTSTRR